MMSRRRFSKLAPSTTSSAPTIAITVQSRAAVDSTASSCRAATISTLAPITTGARCRRQAPPATVAAANTISSARRSGVWPVYSTMARLGRNPAIRATPYAVQLDRSGWRRTSTYPVMSATTATASVYASGTPTLPRRISSHHATTSCAAPSQISVLPYRRRQPGQRADDEREQVARRGGDQPAGDPGRLGRAEQSGDEPGERGGGQRRDRGRLGREATGEAGGAGGDADRHDDPARGAQRFHGE